MHTPTYIPLFTKLLIFFGLLEHVNINQDWKRATESFNKSSRTSDDILDNVQFK